MTKLLRVFFDLLYTHLAWAYDLVAWASSIGQWRTWQKVALEGLPPGEVLELGHGPGHLLIELGQNSRAVFGIDRSRQMSSMAARRLKRSNAAARIARASALALLFPTERFAAVVATFPSDYILDRQALHQARRVLRRRGTLVIIPAAQITGSGVWDRLASWLNRVTHESDGPSEAWLAPLRQVPFEVQTERIRLPRAVVWRIRARRPSAGSVVSHPSPSYNGPPL